MKYLSLFSGIGGFECAIDQVFSSSSKKAKEEAKCLGFSEIDKRAIEVYLNHFPDHPPLSPDGDICKVDFRPFRGKVDLVVGGSPCQDLSSVRRVNQKKGKEKDGLEGKRSGLFFEFLRCLEECQPRHFILENVASMSKQNRDKISELIGVEPVLLNSKNFTAQKRSRLFWCNFPLTPPLAPLTLSTFSDILVPTKQAEELAISSRGVRYFLAPLNQRVPRLVKYKGFYYDTTQPKGPCLLASGKNIVLDYRFSIDPYLYKSKEGTPLFRKLAQVEAERLQGFPDGWTSCLSYSASIKRLGNAVTVPVVVFILEQLQKQEKQRTK